MSKTIRTQVFIKRIFLLSLLVGMMTTFVDAQSTGDIAITGYNADGDDEFAFLSFTNISAGITIYFSDTPWEGGTTFPDNEGWVAYQVPASGVNAGDVIKINPDSESSSNGGTVTSTGYNFAGGGDELYAYLGSDERTPTKFLYAITNEPSWSSAEGQVPGGLNTGTTALAGIGGSVDDNGEYTGTKEGTIATLKSEIEKVEQNWTTTDGKNDQSLDFNTSSFTLLDPPTLAFSTSAMEGGEGTTVDLTVELVESNNTAVSVDIVFLNGPSTAGSTDIGDFTSSNISFDKNATSGTTKSATISLTEGDGFEGTEEAVFQLQGNSIGSIVNPGILTLSIKDSDGDTPNVVINELLADPPDNNAGDANGDGTRDAGDDEFVEIVNNATKAVDISAWKFSDDGGSTIRHIFPSGTVLPAGGSIVVFGGGEPTGGFGGAIVQVSSESGVSFTNSGGFATLLDDEDNIIQNITYGDEGGPDANGDQSLTRDPDITGSLNTQHSEASGSSGALFSPGTKVDGTAFGSKYAIGIRGNEGWRMISSPTKNTSFSDLFGSFWMQGMAGSNASNENATIYSWTETSGGSFQVPSSMSDNMTPGKGYIVYFFEDDENNSPGIQGGFPKIFNSNHDENNSTVSVAVSSTDADGSTEIDGNEGWNLLGNPFGTDISVDGVISALNEVNSDVQANVQVWDHDSGGGNGGWEVLESGDRIAPFQAFWVKFNVPVSESDVTFNQSDLVANNGTQFYKESEQIDRFKFSLRLSDGNYFDDYFLEFSEEGTIGLDQHDAYKLFSLNPNSVNFFSTIQNKKLLKNVLPKELESTLEIPLGFDAPNRESLAISWEGIENIPNEWTVRLIDTELDKEIDLTTENGYSFSINRDQNKDKLPGESNPVLNKTREGGSSRFMLSITPPKNQDQQNTDIPEQVKLNPNYPNPFNPSTTISFELTQQAHVVLNVYTIVGQKVATLVDEVRDVGEHHESWNATDMPSGIYIAQLEVQGKVYIRKMTLIK